MSNFSRMIKAFFEAVLEGFGMAFGRGKESAAEAKPELRDDPDHHPDSSSHQDADLPDQSKDKCPRRMMAGRH